LGLGFSFGQGSSFGLRSSFGLGYSFGLMFSFGLVSTLGLGFSLGLGSFLGLRSSLLFESFVITADSKEHACSKLLHSVGISYSVLVGVFTSKDSSNSMSTKKSEVMYFQYNNYVSNFSDNRIRHGKNYMIGIVIKNDFIRKRRQEKL